MGRSPCCIKEGLKKGPWTEEEDQKLIAFVKEHGHGNWRSLPKKCGLLRCGKSCRLRWTNYLRPDIKRGLFTHSEEQKIIQLHALVGNKWAFIASQLPKRTDNEIKNYWNTVLKKRLEKAGLLSLAGTTLMAGRPAAADQNKGIKSSASNNTSRTHLAQWESARLEAEARVFKESQSSKTQKLLSFSYILGRHSFSSSNHTTSSFSSLPAHSTTTTSALSSSPNSTTTPSTFSSFPQLFNCLLNPPNTFPSSLSKPSLIHHPCTINHLSTTSSLTLPIINSLSNTSSLSLMPSSCSASNSSCSSSNIASSKPLSRLPSQESLASALTLGPTGRLSWQAKEVAFTTCPSVSSTSQSTFISQMLCKINRHHGHEVELNASTKGNPDLKAIRGDGQMNLEATSSMENSMDLNSTVENSMELSGWNDLLFEVENSSSDVVPTHWKDPIMSSSHDATYNSAKSSTLECTHIGQAPNVQDQGSLYLDLLPFNSLISCEQYANQHSNELLWDTLTTHSISSTSLSLSS